MHGLTTTYLFLAVDKLIYKTKKDIIIEDTRSLLEKYNTRDYHEDSNDTWDSDEDHKYPAQTTVPKKYVKIIGHPSSSSGSETDWDAPVDAKKRKRRKRSQKVNNKVNKEEPCCSKDLQDEGEDNGKPVVIDEDHVVNQIFDVDSD